MFTVVCVVVAAAAAVLAEIFRLRLYNIIKTKGCTVYCCCTHSHTHTNTFVPSLSSYCCSGERRVDFDATDGTKDLLRPLAYACDLHPGHHAATRIMRISFAPALNYSFEIALRSVAHLIGVWSGWGAKVNVVSPHMHTCYTDRYA